MAFFIELMLTVILKEEVGGDIGHQKTEGSIRTTWRIEREKILNLAYDDDNNNDDDDDDDDYDDELSVWLYLVFKMQDVILLG
jgi:hypothetical protein